VREALEEKKADVRKRLLLLRGELGADVCAVRGRPASVSLKGLESAERSAETRHSALSALSVSGCPTKFSMSLKGLECRAS
jgi:hypothetical protein